MSSKKKTSYDEKQLEQALVKVKAGMPVRTAALKFNIPKTTLLYKSRGLLSPKIEKPGPECVLGQDNENYLVEWIFYMKKHGFPITKVQLLNSVRMLLNDMKKKTIFQNNMPGRHWYNAFRRRHPEISERISQNLTYSRAAVSEEKIRAWFQEVRDYLEPLDLLDIDDSRKINLDESAFRLNPKSNSVLAAKGDKTVYNIVGNDEKECLTTLICGNAAGQMLPPMVIFPYKRIPRNIVASMPKDWAIGCSDSGWMTAETFYEYIANVLHPWLLKNKIKFPVILYLDGHASHLSYPLTKFCRENKIELIALYPNATHILQPMDVAMFHPLKAAWSHEVRDWRMEHNGESLKRENFAPLLEKSLERLDISEILKNGFKSTGLHPFCPDAINFKKYFESSEIDNTAATVSSINSSNIIDNLKFIENSIEDNLLQQFRSQEQFAHWNGNRDHTSLFLFWQNVKKLASSHLPTTNGVQLINNEGHQSTIQTEEKELEDGEIEENNHKFILDSQPSHKVLVFAVSDDGNLVPINDNQIDIDYNNQDEEQMNLQVQSSSENPIEEQVNLQVLSSSENPDNLNEPSSPSAQITHPNVPSPFKRALFWPLKDKALKKRKAKEKIPTVYTSDSWLKYYDSKEAKKQKLEEEKELKKAERSKNKAIKEAEKIIKKEKLQEKKREEFLKKKKK